MPVCQYVRKVFSKWEYGAVINTDKGALRNPEGTCLTYEEACVAANMSVEGKPRHGTRYVPMHWRN